MLPGKGPGGRPLVRYFPAGAGASTWYGNPEAHCPFLPSPIAQYTNFTNTLADQ